MTKKELRAAMKRCNLSLTEEQRRAASERIFRRVASLPAFADARCVALFCSLCDEPLTAGAIGAWRGERRIVVPRVEGDRMRFFDYDPATLAPGAFGIAEPGPEARLCPAEEIDLMVVPGVAFTPSGARLGRGRGYYDRYLSQPGFRAVKAGVCYAHQLLAELPVEAHDIYMDFVCTD